jgi:hypothetical protein
MVALSRKYGALDSEFLNNGSMRYERTLNHKSLAVGKG